MHILYCDNLKERIKVITLPSLHIIFYYLKIIYSSAVQNAASTAFYFDKIYR